MKKIPFNAHQFLEQSLPGHSAFKFDMSEDAKDATECFSEGFFAHDNSPFFLVPTDHKIKVKHYLARLERFINGNAENFMFHLLQFNDDVAREFLPHVVTEDAKKEFDEVVGLASERLDPRILLKHYNVTPEKMHQILKQHFGFDFAKAAEDIKTLANALNTNLKGGQIPAEKREIIKRGPKTLSAIFGFHKAMEQHLNEADIESKSAYPRIAEKINEVLNYIIEDLQERIRKHNGREAESTVAMSV